MDAAGSGAAAAAGSCPCGPPDADELCALIEISQLDCGEGSAEALLKAAAESAHRDETESAGSSEPKLADEAGGGASRKGSRLLAGAEMSDVQLVDCGEGAPAAQSPRKVPGASQLLVRADGSLQPAGRADAGAQPATRRRLCTMTGGFGGGFTSRLARGASILTPTAHVSPGPAAAPAASSAAACVEEGAVGTVSSLRSESPSALLPDELTRMNSTSL